MKQNKTGYSNHLYFSLVENIKFGTDNSARKSLKVIKSYFEQTIDDLVALELVTPWRKKDLQEKGLIA